MKPICFNGGALLKICAFAFFCLLPWPRTAGGQNMPLDDKAKYERSLEIKVEEVLLKLLGPNQAKVVVQASMDFTRTEKVDMTTQSAAPVVKDGMFKWDGTSVENQMSAEYLLPGFPTMIGDKDRPGGGNYQRQTIYPASFIKQLIVTVILNKDLAENEAQAVRSVVSEMLSMDPKRGDELIIIRTFFAPFWRTIWYTPEAMNLVFKYIILTFMGVIALIVVAVGFLKLAGAMNTMAKAQQSHQQITMDIGKGLGSPGGGLGFGGPEEKLEMPSGEKKEKEESAEEEEQRVVFNVKLDQLGFLVNLMSNEDPANVALVAAHLEPEVRNKFLSMLPPDASSEVMANLAKVRFVDPDIINTIKDELERRLSGALGGLQQVVDVLEQVDLRTKREMLEKLSKTDPETARLVRRKIFMPEDIGLLSDRDMSFVIGNFKIETLSAAIWSFPQALKDKIRKQMAEKTWQMVEQTMRYGAPSKEGAEKAVEELVGAVLKLIKEGRISNPLDEQVMISG
ncbi:MAG: hypothetical protein NTX59_00040 [Elusimicrobia bacterium]|nr:hypothetical protein [Elusimicrobiota bacterium]